MIVGAGPAGATAAALLAGRSHSVVLIDKDRFPRGTSSLGWLSVKTDAVLQEIGVPQQSYGQSPFTDITFISGDFTKVVRPGVVDAPGYIVDRSAFNDILVKRAKKVGVVVKTGSDVIDIRSLEDSVVATLSDGSEVTARLLLLASGRTSPLPESLGFTLPVRHARMWTAQIDATLEDDAYSGPPSVSVVLGLDRPGSFALCFLTPGRLSVSINWLGERQETLTKLAYTCSGLFEKKISPVDLSSRITDLTLHGSPASAALDMDTHTGKHALLIGDAGGFVAAASNEGIYPAMWSAQIASEVVEAALTSVRSQDELMTFESKWRTTMADHLRPPNTDVQFLLPLVFSNQPMADRMCSAFFSGENI